MAFTTFQWDIADKKYLSFVNATHGQEFTSTLFEVDNIKFFLKCYPNGRKKPGLCNLYLTLSSQHWPSNIAKLKINYWLFCPQTHSRMSDIRDFGNDVHNAFHGWATNTLSLKELENNSVNNVSFHVGVNILKIYFKNEVAKGAGDSSMRPQPLIYEKPFKMAPKVAFTWNIRQLMFKSFLSAPNKKCWESQQFDQWVLGCYPNGHTKNDKGNAMIYLKCVGLPPSIYGVKIRYTLFCPQTELKWSYVQTYNYANTNYANASFKTGTLQSLSALSFEITIVVIKLLDLNRKEIAPEQLGRYLTLPSPSLLKNPATVATTTTTTTTAVSEDAKHRTDAEAAEEEESEGERPTKTVSTQNEKQMSSSTASKHFTPNSTLIVHDDGTFMSTNFDLYGTLQGIKERLIGASTNATQNTGNDDDDDEDDPYDMQISQVQQQVLIYTKELQTMNRDIHSIRKAFERLDAKVSKSNQAFQTVLKQVKIIKDEVDGLRQEIAQQQATVQATESAAQEASNATTTVESSVTANHVNAAANEDEQKVNHGYMQMEQQQMMSMIQTQNEIIEQCKLDMQSLKDEMQLMKDVSIRRDDQNIAVQKNADNNAYDELQREMKSLQRSLNDQSNVQQIKEQQQSQRDEEHGSALSTTNTAVQELKQEMKLFRVEYDTLSENVTRFINDEQQRDSRVEVDIEALKRELKEVKKTQRTRNEATVTELSRCKNLCDGLAQQLEQQQHAQEHKMAAMQTALNKLTEQQSIFEQSNSSMVRVASMDDAKENDSSEETEKKKRVKQWLFDKLHDVFTKNDLDAVYNKLISDGVNDVSLLSDMTDETLATMVKLLRATRSIAPVADEQDSN
eukprot:CAMPEP_0202690378 /NCGR_PEP_ID=MMETSP1385-20130828/5375_1 /ASSEMBLY_ACC=CAM_ASM_000861 /TAXON_ID=933848 /ORGANISM="Elphidium margaritaceum" /LENGTH=848 /DNA_ID=CAMNT_0049345639 /DNA_START=43 /DNA_END=2589 /DNA_ORIENTATION=+